MSNLRSKYAAIVLSRLRENAANISYPPLSFGSTLEDSDGFFTGRGHARVRQELTTMLREEGMADDVMLEAAITACLEPVITTKIHLDWRTLLIAIGLQDRRLGASPGVFIRSRWGSLIKNTGTMLQERIDLRFDAGKAVLGDVTNVSDKNSNPRKRPTFQAPEDVRKRTKKAADGEARHALNPTAFFGTCSAMFPASSSQESTSPLAQNIRPSTEPSAALLVADVCLDTESSMYESETVVSDPGEQSTPTGYNFYPSFSSPISFYPFVDSFSLDVPIASSTPRKCRRSPVAESCEAPSDFFFTVPEISTIPSPLSPVAVSKRKPSTPIAKQPTFKRSRSAPPRLESGPVRDGPAWSSSFKLEVLNPLTSTCINGKVQTDLAQPPPSTWFSRNFPFGFFPFDEM